MSDPPRPSIGGESDRSQFLFFHLVFPSAVHPFVSLACSDGYGGTHLHQQLNHTLGDFESGPCKWERLPKDNGTYEGISHGSIGANMGQYENTFCRVVYP